MENERVNKLSVTVNGEEVPTWYSLIEAMNQSSRIADGADHRSMVACVVSIAALVLSIILRL